MFKLTYYDFYINNTLIDIVDSFKYLRMTLHNLFTVLRHELPLLQQCSLFDSLVASILHFGSEVWEFHETTNIELIHTKCQLSKKLILDKNS